MRFEVSDSHYNRLAGVSTLHLLVPRDELELCYLLILPDDGGQVKISKKSHNVITFIAHDTVGTRFYRIRDLSTWGQRSMNCGRDRIGSLPFYEHFLFLAYHHRGAHHDASSFLTFGVASSTGARDTSFFLRIAGYSANTRSTKTIMLSTSSAKATYDRPTICVFRK
jgi:hypothetical protein